MTIRIKLTGGLGNQMFQFATGFTIAKKKNVRLSLDLNYINRRNLFNGFELQKIFNIYSRVSFLNKPLSFMSINFLEILNKTDKTFNCNDFISDINYLDNILFKFLSYDNK